MDLFSCPEFQQLSNLIRIHEIEALAVYDRDRLEAKGLQRLIFLSECKDAGVELVICQGPPIIDGPEGQIVELALAIGKERQVLRARQGSKDGLHDRAVIHKKPITYHKLYGYQWEKENNRLIPDGNWASIKLIFDMLLKGASFKPILQELETRGILSPSGQTKWNKTAISNFIHNPVYTGRYFSLKAFAAEPKRRKIINSYGNSSVRRLPLDQAYYMPEITIVNPPITWEQRGRILQQLEKHQKLSQRNANNDYLLRGMVFCETHRGGNGEPRRYQGMPKRSAWYYKCPVGGCSMPYIDGSKIEETAKQAIMYCLTHQPNEFYELIAHTNNPKELKRSLLGELNSLENKYNKNINAEAGLESRSLLGQIHQEVYQRLKAKFRSERQWIKDKKLSINEQMAQLNREAEAVASLEKIGKKFAGRLNKLTKADWRELLIILNFEIHIEPPVIDTGTTINWFATQTDDVSEREGLKRLNEEENERYHEEIKSGKIKGLIKLHMGVPLMSFSLDETMAQLAPRISDIVLRKPEPG